MSFSGAVALSVKLLLASSPLLSLGKNFEIFDLIEVFVCDCECCLWGDGGVSKALAVDGSSTEVSCKNESIEEWQKSFTHLNRK